MLSSVGNMVTILIANILLYTQSNDYSVISTLTLNINPLDSFYAYY